MSYLNYFKHNRLLLKAILITCSLCYCFLSLLPKHPDFNELNRIAIYVATGHFDIYQYGLDTAGVAYATTMHPPLFYYIQGIWIFVGLYFDLFHLNLGVLPTSPLIQFFSFIPRLVILFSAIILTYYYTQNKWLSIIWFGSLSFISIIIMGQDDIACAFLIYVSMLAYIKGLNSNYYLQLFSYVILGLSISIKTYGGLLFPCYFLISLYKSKFDTASLIKTIQYALTICFSFGAGFLLFYILNIKDLFHILLEGQSSWLFNLQISPINLPADHIISIWFFGYILIMYWLFINLHSSQYLVENLEKLMICTSFFIFSWFFITVYSYPQWYIILTPTIIFVCDRIKSELNYIFLTILMFIFLFYSMLWENNIDIILKNYIPIINLSGNLAIIVLTGLVTTLLLWCMNIKDHYDMPKNGTNECQSNIFSQFELISLIVIFFFIIFFVIYFISDTSDIGSSQMQANKPIGLINNSLIGQSFQASSNKLSGISILFGTYARNNDNNIIFHLKESKDSKDDLFTHTINANVLKDNQYFKFKFPTINDSKNQSYYFYLESPDSFYENSVAVWSWSENSDLYPLGNCLLNNEDIEGDLTFISYYG